MPRTRSAPFFAPPRITDDYDSAATLDAPGYARSTSAHALAAVSKARERVLGAFSTLWRLIGWLWLIVALGAIATLVARALRLSYPRLGSMLIPLVALLITALAALTWYAGMATLLRAIRRRDTQRATYTLRRVRRLRGDHLVPRYISSVYLPRRDATTSADADDLTATALRLARNRVSRVRPISLATLTEGSLGVCIYGAATQGKTRLAWEALHSELPGWLLLRWPLEPHVPLDLTQLYGRRVALWLDDLSRYTAPTVAAELSDLPRRLALAGARVVIVATCRDGADEARVRRALSGLLERLTTVRLADITNAEADILTTALAKVGVTVQRASFDGSPGSLLLDVRHMRAHGFAALSRPARQTLWALQLLRSTGLTRFPRSRVWLVARAFFGADPRAWDRARAELVAAGWLRDRDRDRASGERLLEPLADVYIERATPSYLTPNAEVSDDWPQLAQAFERQGDAAALLTLGHAFVELMKGVGPLLPYDTSEFKQRGVACFRAALSLRPQTSEPLEWALAQLELGVAIATWAERAIAAERADRWLQALAACHAALDTFDGLEASMLAKLQRVRRNGPFTAYRALAHLTIAEIEHQRASDILLAGDETSALDRLATAETSARAALALLSAPGCDPARRREAAWLVSMLQETQAALIR